MTAKPDLPPADALENAGATPVAGALDVRGIASAALLVMVFFVLSRVTGLAREIVIGAQYGTSAQLDAYLAAFRLPDILFQLVAGGALGSAFIPTFAGYWVKDDRSGAWLLFSRVLNLMTLLLVVCASVAALFAEPIVARIIAPGFAPAQQALTADLMRWMLLSTIVFGASGLVMGALNAVQHFLLPAAAPVVYNVAIILGAWILAPSLGVYGLVVGVVAGAVGHLLIQLPVLFGYGVHYSASLAWRDPGVREVARLMGPRVLGLFFVQMHFLVNTILASRLAAGSLSALNYAWLIMLLPQGVFAQAVSTAAFPTFAAQVAGGHEDLMRRTFGNLLRTLVFALLPAAVGLFVLATPLVAALLERGEFTPRSTQMVVYALRFFALGLVAHGVVEIVVRAFYALHDTKTPVVVGVGAMVLNILLSVLLVRPLSYGGLALANSLATSLEMVALLWLLARRMGGIEARRLASSVMRSSLAALVMGGALWLWLRWSHTWLSGAEPGAWLWLGSGLVVGMVVYVGAALLVRSREIQPLIAMVRHRLG